MVTEPATEPLKTATQRRSSIRRVAVALGPGPEGRDATMLGAVLARGAGAETVLLAVEPDLLLVLPDLEYKRVRRETEDMLARTRESMAPSARIKVTSDFSVARGIKRLVQGELCDLLVVGSSVRGAGGRVMIGKLTRQLFDQVGCAVAIAPRGLSRGPVTLRRVGVGFDAGPEARQALAVAAGIAAGAGAELIVRGVVDDRIPSFGWPQAWVGGFRECWQEVIGDEVETLRASIQTAAAELETKAEVEVRRGRPSTSLRELSEEVDLLVIGSRRWGAMARLVLGGTGEALVDGARCSLLVVPRPESQ
jgi:nucleotide-binding universal stress UspA family protein